MCALFVFRPVCVCVCAYIYIYMCIRYDIYIIWFRLCLRTLIFQGVLWIRFSFVVDAAAQSVFS
jgi:hypothetical protein